MATDKQTYYRNLRENVTIYGNLTYNETPVTDGLIGLEVRDPLNRPLTARVRNTGTTPPTTPYVWIISIVPCDVDGNPKESFPRGTAAYFQIKVINYDQHDRPVRVTLNVYDQNNIPLGRTEDVFKEMAPQEIMTFTAPFPIPDDATIGIATLYANVFTDWPSSYGWPYDEESSADFLITEGCCPLATSLPKTQLQALTSNVTGSCNVTFQLPRKTPTGNYTIYATSRYMGQEAFSNATFTVLLEGDFDGDGDIDISDIRYFCRAFIKYSETGECDPRCDFDDDGDIDINDIRYFSKAYRNQ